MSETFLKAERTSEARQPVGGASPVDPYRQTCRAERDWAQQQEQPTGLGLRPVITKTGCRVAKGYVEPTSEASKHVGHPLDARKASNVPNAHKPVGFSRIVEYKEPRRIDTSNMSVRGKQFFSKCPV